MKYKLGIDVGGTKIAYGLFDEDYRLVCRATEPSRPELSAEAMMDVLCAQIDSILADQILTRADLAFVGLAIPGHIHFDRGVVVSAANLPNWKGVAVRDALSERLGVPVLLDNDANVAALAEYRMGSGRGCRNLVYLTLSTGIGCGLILNGELFRGTYGAAGEIGHTTVRSNSKVVCGCGRTGCVEAAGSGTAIRRIALARLCEGAKSSLSDLPAETLSARDVLEAAEAGDALSLEIVEDASDAIAQVFYNVCQIFNCDRIVFGGGMSNNLLLMSLVLKKFSAMLPPSEEFPVDVLPAQLGDETGILGAALLG